MRSSAKGAAKCVSRFWLPLIDMIGCGKIWDLRFAIWDLGCAVQNPILIEIHFHRNFEIKLHSILAHCFAATIFWPLFSLAILLN